MIDMLITDIGYCFRLMFIFFYDVYFLKLLFFRKIVLISFLERLTLIILMRIVKFYNIFYLSFLVLSYKLKLLKI